MSRLDAGAGVLFLSITRPPSPISHIEKAMVALAGLAFVIIATWRLEYPGLYYDELLFIPPSAWLFDSCDLSAGVYAKIGCVPIIIQPPYLGSLKSLLFAPIFYAYGVDAQTIRLPAIGLLLAANLLMWWFFRPRLGAVIGFWLLLALCTDPVPIFHAKVDWGPYAIANFFKVAALCAAIAWVESKNPRYLFYLCASVFLGVFDKLNFLWVVLALAAGLLLVYGFEARRAILQRSRATLAILSTALLLGAVWFFVFMRPIVRASASDKPFVFTEQVHRILNLVMNTLDMGAYRVIFGGPWPGLMILSKVVLAANIAGLGVCFALPLIRRYAGRESDIAGLASLTAFVSIVNAVLLGCMIVTRETGGPHHAVVLTHVWHLQFASLVATAMVALGRYGLATRPLAVATGAATLAAVLVLNVVSLRHHLAAETATHAFPPIFSPAIASLARSLDADFPDDQIVSVDWGLHNALFSLTRERRGRFADRWPTFKDVGEGKVSPADGAKALPHGERLVFIMRPQSIAAFPATNDGFLKLVKSDPGCQQPPLSVRDGAGRVIYLVYSLARSCLI